MEEQEAPIDKYADFRHLDITEEEMEALYREREQVLDLHVDVAAAAAEVKKLIDEQKMDLVDYTRLNLEIWPTHDMEKLPELSKFAQKWQAFFDYGDKLCVKDTIKAEHFPQTTALEYESKNKEIEDLVNNDGEFWDRIRAVVLPLYEPPEMHLSEEQLKQRAEKDAVLRDKDRKTYEAKMKSRTSTNKLLEAWRTKRWQKIELFFDCLAQDCTTTIIWTNPDTGAKHRGEVFRSTEYPQGFVIKIV